MEALKKSDFWYQLPEELIAQTGDAVIPHHLDDNKDFAVRVIAFEILQSLLCFPCKCGIIPFELGKGIDFVEMVFHENSFAVMPRFEFV